MSEDAKLALEEQSNSFILNVELEELQLMISETADLSGNPLSEEELLTMERRILELESILNKGSSPDPNKKYE